jgi:argonaute-like protein implicated in RNA metabolism and viral defense
MIQIYDTQWLAYAHLMYSSEVARQCLPPFEEKDMPEAALKLLKEFNDFDKLKNEFIEIVADGKVDAAELQRFNKITKELQELNAAIITFSNAKQKE